MRNRTPWWLQTIIWVGILTLPTFAFYRCADDSDPPAYEIAPDGHH